MTVSAMALREPIASPAGVQFGPCASPTRRRGPGEGGNGRAAVIPVPVSSPCVFCYRLS